MRAIIHLGGNPSRIESTIKKARLWPDALIIIGTSEVPIEHYRQLYEAGIDMSRVIFDFHAWDTVTNFTKILPLLERENVDAICIVTDKFHMLRSMLIAYIVYCGRDIDIHTFAHYDPIVRGPDSKLRLIKDIGRSVAFLITGQSIFDLDIARSRLRNIRETEYKFHVFLRTLPIYNSRQ